MRHPERKNIRLSGYRYDNPGAYYVTICTRDRACIFGAVINGEMCLNHSGRIVEEEWFRSAIIRREITLDAFIVMPNHIHGIVIINNGTSDRNVSDDTGAQGRAPLHEHNCHMTQHQHSGRLHRLPRSLGSFVAGFKSSATKRINVIRNTPGFSLWQRNYYDHIVRNESDLNRIRQYIRDNPMRWHLDRGTHAWVDNVGRMNDDPEFDSPS